MGLLNHKAIQNYITGTVSIKDIHQVLNEQLGQQVQSNVVDKKM